MPICHERQFIFFHIPRCGGTSLEVSLDLMSRDKLHGVCAVGQKILTLQHLPAPDLLAFGLVDDDIIRTYFKFTVIRDPFERMASDYVWQKRHDRHHEFGNLGFTEYLTVAERIVREDRFYEKVHYDHFRPMVDYCVHNGEMLVDEVLTLEHIGRGLSKLEDRLGKFQLRYLNHIDDYSGLRTTENIDRVYELYECDRVLYENISLISANG